MFKGTISFVDGDIKYSGFMNIYNDVLAANNIAKSIGETGKQVFKMIGTSKNPIKYTISGEYLSYEPVHGFFGRVKYMPAISIVDFADIYLIKANTIYISGTSVSNIVNAVATIIDKYHVSDGNRVPDPEDLIKSIQKD